MNDSGFFIAAMPPSRPADYYLGYMDGCVFIDFNDCEGGRICLVRVSFDGYGCCDLKGKIEPLNTEDSNAFKSIVKGEIVDQSNLLTIVRKAVALNKDLIWLDALQEYHLA